MEGELPENPESLLPPEAMVPPEHTYLNGPAVPSRGGYPEYSGGFLNKKTPKWEGQGTMSRSFGESKVGWSGLSEWDAKHLVWSWLKRAETAGHILPYRPRRPRQ